MDEWKDPIRYPRLWRRVQAVLIDSIILSAAFFGAAVFISSTDINAFLKIGFVAFFPIVLEPGLVSATGATIGHRLRGLRVARADNGGNLDFVRATARFLVKSLLGLPSLFFVLLTKRHQAIHDLVTRSVVVLETPSKVEDHEALPERVIEEDEFVYPSKPRRIFIIIVYAFGSLMLSVFTFSVFVSNACLYVDNCNATDHFIEILVATGWLMILVAVMVLGWKCRLWGCRRFGSGS